MTNIKYPAARSIPVIHVALQFRPIRRGMRRKNLLRTYQCTNGSKISITLVEELDIADQDVLLCFLAMARAENKGSVISLEPRSPENRALRTALALDGYATTRNAVVVKSTIYEVLKELGRSANQTSYEWFKKSIIRLSRVSFVYDGTKGWWKFNLLSVSGVHNGDSKASLSVCLNPLSAQAVLADNEGYTLIHRGERAELSSEEAKALHSVLCGLVDMGASRFLGVDMLSNKVYSRYDDEINNTTVRKRRKSLVDAIPAINTLRYWTCSVKGKGRHTTIHVARKRRSDVST
jgi:hypothetical protein